MLKHAFLDSAGITDERPYLGMTQEETIRAIIKNADIKASKIGAATYTGHKLITSAQLNPTQARKLGEILRPLLDKAAKEGRIERHTGGHNPQWDMKQQAEAKRLEVLLRADFCRIAEIEDDFSQATLLDLVHSKYKLLSQNVGLSYEKIGKKFTPPVTHLYISHRLSGYLKYDKNFVFEFAKAIKPHLIKAVKDGWLDEKKFPLAYDQILRQQLDVPNSFLDGKHGTEAVLHCIDKAGLPASAVSSLIGEDWSWIARLKNMSVSIYKDEGIPSRNAQVRETNFFPSDVARIARAIKPYVHGKPFNGVLEITEPLHLQAHAIAKKYVVEKLKQNIPASITHEIDLVMEGLNSSDNAVKNTLGPTLKALRLQVNLKQSDFEPELGEKQLGRYERNYFNPRCLNNEGQLNQVLCKHLDRFVDVVAERLQAKDAGLSWAAREDARANAAAGQEQGRPF